MKWKKQSNRSSGSSNTPNGSKHDETDSKEEVTPSAPVAISNPEVTRISNGDESEEVDCAF